MDNSERDCLSQTLHQAQALKTVLDNEFDALRAQDLATFDRVQAQKMDILNFFANEELLQHLKRYTSDHAEARELKHWDEVMTLIAACKDLHRRNEILIHRKLESIRGALQTIQSPDPLNTIEVYDRLGKLRPNHRRQSIGDA